MSGRTKQQKPCPRGHHHFSQGWEMGVRRIGQRCDCGQMEIAQTSVGGIIERIQPPSPPADRKDA